MASLMDAPRPRAQRVEPRIPFFTPVVADGLSRCWATNLSSRGIGLTALADGERLPARGAEIEMALTLGRSKRPLRALGRIAWRSVARPDGRFGMGVEFCELAPSDRAALARFVEAHRPRVIVALATPSDRDVALDALDDLQVDFVDDAEDVTHDALWSCASVFVFSDDIARTTAFLEALWSHHGEIALVPGESPLAPVTLCTALDAELIVPHTDEGRIYDILRAPVDRVTLSLAAARSCRHWALQLELSWASLQIEGIAGHQLAPSPREPPPRTHGPTIIRVSAPMLEAYQLIRTVAVHDVPVLLLGETGTGKELAAREVHALSRRANTPFVAQDCGALTETLLESELFGHVKGAFTGATSDHPGLFQIADGGTIFLDEIQNTTPALQAKLLRVVEEGEIRPVGSPKVRQVDVRLIAACNRDLRNEVREGRFRADFFYRLNRFPIELPPLRARREGVLELARHFVGTLVTSLGRPSCALDPRFEEALLAYDWPGNVRELRNAIERAILLTPPGEPLRWEVLPDDVRGVEPPCDASSALSLDEQVDDYARRIIQKALDRNGKVIRRTAADLHCNAITLSRRMRKLGIT